MFQHALDNLKEEYDAICAIIERDNVPDGVKVSLTSAKAKLDALYQSLKERYQVNSEWVRDPAMGLIQMERRSLPLDKPGRYYGVCIPVFNVISLRIHSAEVNQATGEFRPLEVLAEIDLPESEWGKAVASPNSGHGCATLRALEGEPVETYDPEKDPCNKLGRAVANGITQTISNQREELEKVLQETLTALTDKKRLGKKDGAKIAHDIKIMATNLPANVAYRAEQMLVMADNRAMAIANEINLMSKGVI